MTDEDDDLDPSDWLAAQFGEDPPKPTPAVPPVTPPAVVPPVTPPAVVPQVPPPAPTPPVYQAPPTAPPAYQPPYVAQPSAPPWPPAAEQAAPPWPPTAAQPPQQAIPGPVPGGFNWGLTPGAETTPPAIPAQPLPAEPFPPAAPYVPAPSAPSAAVPPVTPAPTFPPMTPPPPAAAPPFGEQAPAAYPPYVAAPAPAFGEQPPSVAPPSVENPPIASPPGEQPPTQAFTAFTEQSTTAFPAFGAYPGQSVEPVPMDPSRWLAAPLDPALDGVTEVLEAELVGLTGPQGEGVEASALDDLFGDNQFRDFSDEPLVGSFPTRVSGGSGGSGRTPKAARAPRAPIPRNQLILMIVAGALIAALALVALYALGMKLASLTPAPAVVPSPSPSASAGPAVLPIGPVKPGDYHWDQLLGGECLKPFESAWQDKYTVVDCATPHPAQLVFRGVFTDPASATYPGTDELQKRINLLCTPATIINYAAAGTVQDIQVQASYAVDEEDWDGGNHTYFCFVNRSGGGDLAASVAVQQVPVTPTATPTPSVSATPGAPVTRGHGKGVKPTN